MDTPAVDRKVLVLLAGLVWSAVGLALIAVAAVWVASAHGPVVAAVFAGLVLGVVVYRFGFSKLVIRNRTRIYEQAPGKAKVCVFAFQNIRSYAIILIMMLMGYTLRHLPISRLYLVPVYLGIGLGLLLSSFGYYGSLWSEL